MNVGQDVLQPKSPVLHANETRTDVSAYEFLQRFLDDGRTVTQLTEVMRALLTQHGTPEEREAYIGFVMNPGDESANRLFQALGLCCARIAKGNVCVESLREAYETLSSISMRYDAPSTFVAPPLEIALATTVVKTEILHRKFGLSKTPMHGWHTRYDVGIGGEILVAVYKNGNLRSRWLTSSMTSGQLPQRKEDLQLSPPDVDRSASRKHQAKAEVPSCFEEPNGDDDLPSREKMGEAIDIYAGEPDTSELEETLAGEDAADNGDVLLNPEVSNDDVPAEDPLIEKETDPTIDICPEPDVIEQKETLIDDDAQAKEKDSLDSETSNEDEGSNNNPAIAEKMDVAEDICPELQKVEADEQKSVEVDVSPANDTLPKRKFGFAGAINQDPVPVYSIPKPLLLAYPPENPAIEEGVLPAAEEEIPAISGDEEIPTDQKQPVVVMLPAGANVPAPEKDPEETSPIAIAASVADEKPDDEEDASHSQHKKILLPTGALHEGVKTVPIAGPTTPKTIPLSLAGVFTSAATLAVTLNPAAALLAGGAANAVVGLRYLLKSSSRNNPADKKVRSVPGEVLTSIMRNGYCVVQEEKHLFGNSTPKIMSGISLDSVVADKNPRQFDRSKLRAVFGTPNSESLLDIYKGHQSTGSGNQLYIVQPNPDLDLPDFDAAEQTILGDAARWADLGNGTLRTELTMSELAAILNVQAATSGNKLHAHSEGLQIDFAEDVAYLVLSEQIAKEIF
ncbi:MAG: hypothetical protein LBI34_02765 [Puniceicoccales bacterium]|jgi:hypothetical protein|nr:hypothetical protein [Puniceicoccales bacterium]